MCKLGAFIPGQVHESEAWRSLPPAAAKVFVSLSAHANKEGIAFPSVARLAELAGLSERTVQRALRQLEQAGLIARAPGGGRKSNTYTVLRADETQSVGARHASPTVPSPITYPATEGDPWVAPTGPSSPHTLPRIAEGDACVAPTLAAVTACHPSPDTNVTPAVAAVSPVTNSIELFHATAAAAAASGDTEGEDPADLLRREGFGETQARDLAADGRKVRLAIASADCLARRGRLRSRRGYLFQAITQDYAPQEEAVSLERLRERRIQRAEAEKRQAQQKREEARGVAEERARLTSARPESSAMLAAAMYALECTTMKDESRSGHLRA